MKSEFSLKIENCGDKNKGNIYMSLLWRGNNPVSSSGYCHLKKFKDQAEVIVKWWTGVAQIGLNLEKAKDHYLNSPRLV